MQAIRYLKSEGYIRGGSQFMTPTWSNNLPAEKNIIDQNTRGPKSM